MNQEIWSFVVFSFRTYGMSQKCMTYAVLLLLLHKKYTVQIEYFLRSPDNSIAASYLACA